MITSYLPCSSEKIADCLMQREDLLNEKWSYDYGVVWRGMEMLYNRTQNSKYFDYIHDALDSVVEEDGQIRDYDYDEFNLDYLCNGRQLIWLWQMTGRDKYKNAAHLLRSQISSQPRTSDGGFWHKKIYPFQMWLDGQHMAIPFYIQYELLFGGETQALDDAAAQLILAWRHTLNPQTGLPCHGWDEKRQQIWADPVTGRAAHAWGRAVGWYMVALIDSLELLPKSIVHYEEVLNIFQTLAQKLLSIREQDVWLQVLDCPGRMGNYAESSGSCLIAYAILKGVRLGLLPQEYGIPAQDSFRSIQRHFVGQMKNGEYFIAKCCHGAGLGGAAARDGSYDYYISEKVGSFDLKATGAYIQAACEYEHAVSP